MRRGRMQCEKCVALGKAAAKKGNMKRVKQEQVKREGPN